MPPVAAPSQNDSDRVLQVVDALQQRIKNGSLGDLVEWLTAFAICFRAAVDGKTPDPAIDKIAQEMVQALSNGRPDRYEGDDAESRRARVERFVKAMPLDGLVALADEMAESFREVLLSKRTDRLRRFLDGLNSDIALAGNPLVHELVRLDRDRALEFELLEEEQAIMADCASPTPA